MKRRFALAAAVTLLALPAMAQTKWDLPAAYPATNYHSVNLQKFADAVKASSGGKLEIVVHPGASLFKAPEIKRAVQTGQAPIGEILVSNFENEDPIYGIDVVPFLATSFADAKKLWLAQKPVLEKKAAAQGMMVLFAVPWPPQGLYAKNAFYQVMDVTEVPAIASHSSARHFTPGFERNMSDDMIKRLAENGGVIQINFGSSFVTQESQDKRKANAEKVNQYMEDNNLESDHPDVKDFAKKVAEDNPVFCDVTDVADHFDHVVDLVGIDHVAFGSDYDGVGDTLPYNLKDPSHFPNLIYHLLKRGYSEEDIEKICYKNIWRVWQATEDFAKDFCDCGKPKGECTSGACSI